MGAGSPCCILGQIVRVLSVFSFAFHLALQADDSPRVSRNNDSNLRKGLGKLIEPRSMQFIDSLKPYKGGQELFWVLHEANIIDKHYTLLSTGRYLLCDMGKEFQPFLLKQPKPTFTGVDISNRQKLVLLLGFPSERARLRDSRALIPTLNRLTEFVEGQIESFREFLVKS